MATRNSQQNSESKNSSFSTQREKSKNKLAKSKEAINKELEENLIRKHYGLVVSQALKFIGSDKQLLEDYIQVGLIGLLKAVRKYDKDRSRFSTFATTCIKNELINFVNRSVKRDKKLKVIYNTDLLLTLSEKYTTET